MDDKDTPNVWWMEASSSDRDQTIIKPYFADVDLKNDRLEEMAEMGRALNSHSAYPPQYVPDEFRWVLQNLSDKDRDLPDAFFSISRALVVSEAMRNTLVHFDLGTSQIFECPLFEIKARDKMGRTEADRSKQDPRRWFILHISEEKPALLPEKSKDLSKYPKKGSGFFRMDVPDNPGLTLSKDIALNGPHIWKQKGLSGVFFFTDTILSAIKAKGLRTHAMKFVPCRLV